MSSFEGLNTHEVINTYLLTHPTPWHIAEGRKLDGMGRDGAERDDMVQTSRVWEVRDANANSVLPPCEPSPKIKDLVDFVNALGAALHTIAQVEARQKVHDWYKGRAGTLSEADKQRIMESARRRFRGNE